MTTAAYGYELPCPKGWHWRELEDEDHARLAPIWRQSRQGLSRAPFWRDWFHALADIHSGRFDPHFMHAIGLFDDAGILWAVAAEVENFDHAGSSQILIQTSDPGQSDQLKEFSVLAAIALARQRGSRFANVQCNKDSAIYTLALTQGEPVCDHHHWSEFRIVLHKAKFAGITRFYKLLGNLYLGGHRLS